MKNIVYYLFAEMEHAFLYMYFGNFLNIFIFSYFFDYLNFYHNFYVTVTLLFDGFMSLLRFSLMKFNRHSTGMLEC